MNTIKWIEQLEKLSRKEIIKETEILDIIPEDTHMYWDVFMRGKTCPILESGEQGVYGWDLKQFLN
jgi:hypothetical protein